MALICYLMRPEHKLSYVFFNLFENHHFNFIEKINNLIVWIRHDEYRNNLLSLLGKVVKTLQLVVRKGERN